ncbi:apolipoprotein N-acyltransferase [Tichowtungia aerotolerans]|uniref:Apolipoprotein N-acyltransferase n=1 Tax=Tichowtungia aerotolerans TaxID=2697043 RepID=A0A6P1M204_9BACT|nr:apolipoprotein N-acyltransferase [Tichowtungia aerotolerans]QHI68859.1 apolipoprotein N-acyltransferase [Tichowtungia aerotolerans]
MISRTKQKKGLPDSTTKRLRPAAAVVSGILMFMSFPPHETGFFGWIALVPLIMACAGVPLRRAAFLGWLAGAVFFVGSLYWLRHVTWAGYLSLSLYSALYFIPFAMLTSARPGGWSTMSRSANIGWMAALAAVWAASEYLRSTLITGFPWNLLGVSQYAQISLIQIAAWGGVYLLSALMVFVNAGVAVTLLQYASGRRQTGYKMHIEFMVSMFVLAFASSYGLRVLLSKEAPADNTIHAALIQPNIPEVGNWEMADPELIYDRLEKLTDLAVRTPELDLVIWPETALPDFVRYSQRSAEMVQRFTAEGVPLLAGSMDMEWLENGDQAFYNSSLLFNNRGELLDIYSKQHLVLFGEYIPFEEKIAFINALTPIESSFSPGKETTLFNLPGNPYAFSVLICFEDTLPYLSRRAARQGASWLINQTNDSWFDPDCGSVQHLAHAVFRSVETRLPMFRCTNTGVTCAIDSKGRIHKTLEPRTQGFQVASLRPADVGMPPTFYTLHGDRFAQACLLASGALFISLRFKSRKISHA